MSSPEEIRRKRAEKLQAAAAATVSTSNIEVEATTLAPINKKNDNSTDINPQSKNIPQIQNSAIPLKSIDEWTTIQVEEIMSATVDIQRHANNWNTFYLEDLLEDAKDGKYLTIDHLDSVISYAAMMSGVKPLFYSSLSYMQNIFTKANNAKRLVNNKDSLKDEKIEFLNEIIRLSAAYGSLIFYEADAFHDEPQLNDSIKELRENSLKYLPFWMAIQNAVVDNETQLEFLNPVLDEMTKQLKDLDFSTDTPLHNYFQLFEVIVNNKQMAMNIYKVKNFHPTNLKAKELENNTILGRLLSISPLLLNIALLNYQETMTKDQIRIVHESLQASYPVTVDKLFSIVNLLIRASTDSRLAVLTWMADLVNKNHLRTSEHSDNSKLSSDSLMLNVTLILFKFSLPILKDGSLSKIDKVSIDYLNYRNRLVDLKEETKINSTIQEFNEYYSDKMYERDLRLNFVSECFYLMLTYLHYGLGGLIISSKKYHKMLKSYKEQYNKMKETIDKMNINSSMNQNPMIQMLMKRLEPLEKRIKALFAWKQSIEMFFQTRSIQLEVFDIIIGSCEFFVRLIDPKHEYHPKMGSFFNQLTIPLNNFDDDISKLDDVEYLRKLSPLPFKYFPEMYLEGIINYCHFIAKLNNNPMFNNESKLVRLVEFSIIVLRCPELISNPHLKARLTEVLFFGSLPLHNGNGNEQNGYMIEIFNEDETVKKNLLVSLLDFYVMVEKTGASSQFYDKFNSRYHISFIVEKLWQFDEFKDDLKRISNNLQQFFVRLVARMLNDATFLLDESLNHLHTIHECQKELDLRTSGIEPSNEDSDEDLQKRLDESERIAKSYVQLANKTILLFSLFTKETPRSFVIIEIVDRLAGMLNYNLQALVGKKCGELKVKNPESYKFDPIELLFQICSIFINLSGEKEFINAVARDLRSFNPENIRKANKILKKNYKVPNSDWENKLLEFTNFAEETAAKDAEEELELGDVPDEFLDPLMYTLMKDPVLLPASKISMDRSVLKAHLMNDPTDPFNRMPLKLEEVESDLELKHKIQTWILSQKQKKIEQDKDGDVTMD